MDDIAGDSSFRHSSAMVVGSGSISHDFDGALVISVFTDSSQRESQTWIRPGVSANMVDLAGSTCI